MAGSKVMRRLTIGVLLVAASAHATVSTSGAATGRSDIEVAEDISAGSPPTSAVWVPPAAPEKAKVVTAPPAPAPAPERTLSANPLWAIPLTALSGTRERPLFSASRRPPPALATAPVPAPKVVAVKPRERERPQLDLVGTIASGDEGFGIFLNQSTKVALRLKVGEDYQGWKLRSVQGREATLEKDQLVFTLELPQNGTAPIGQKPAEVRNEARNLPAASAGKLLSVTSQPRPDRFGR
jgi:general secretion pathway protein N